MATYRLFGLTLASDLRLTKRVALLGNSAPDVVFTHTTVESLPSSQSGLPPTYVSPYKTPDGKSLLYVYRQPECDVLNFPNTADFYVWTDRIECYRLRRAYQYEIEKWLVGTVLAVWLERHGTPVLHASAVVVDDGAVAFLASNIGGKSCLAAAFMQSGYSLLTDDVLPLAHNDATCIAQPGYPQMRLWPHEATHFLGHCEDLELVHPKASKRAVPVGPNGWGTFCDVPQKLRCLYIPARRNGVQAGTAVEISPVSPRDALIELVRHSFSTRLMTALELQPQRLSHLAQIAEQVPMRRIIYPDGLEHLARVSEAIVTDVKALP